MADLIDRQAAIELFVRKEEEFCQAIEARAGRPVPIRPRFAEGIALELKKLPAIDAVKVVRCGNCGRRDKASDLPHTVYCMAFEGTRQKTDYCNYAEEEG